MRQAARLSPVEPDSNVFPLVAPKRTSNRPVWIPALVLAFAAILLFLALDSRRRALTAPATQVPAETPGGFIEAPPELALPRASAPDVTQPPVFRVGVPTSSTTPAARFGAAPRTLRTPATNTYRPSAGAPPAVPPYAETYAPPAYEPNRYEPPLPPPAETVAADAFRPAGVKERVFASRLANPAMTVPLGTVIPGVLETALDSTQPGAVRAIVSRDVRGFDGSKILVPRGSRLYGEYGAELGSGQNRALIRWARLVRPDGAIVALDSPASDPLGRAGVRGEVDSKFLARFGDALLQSTLNIGTSLATRSLSGDALVLALPGATQVTSAAVAPRQPQPTLRVRQGTSVSVFVARDLDFSPVEN